MKQIFLYRSFVVLAIAVPIGFNGDQGSRRQN